jgi:uracil phosphoribosyltransferase
LNEKVYLIPFSSLISIMIDSKILSQAYIVPGLGDFGDRYFGTVQEYN